MKIEIPDYLYEKLVQSMKEKHTNEEVEKHIYKLIKDDISGLLLHISDIDGLTGLKSRNKLTQDIHNAIWGNEGKYSTNYVCFDIDNFKKYLDYNGLSEGDELLKRIANKLNNEYKNSNIYRVGGDEFIIEI